MCVICIKNRFIKHFCRPPKDIDSKLLYNKFRCSPQYMYKDISLKGGDSAKENSTYGIIYEYVQKAYTYKVKNNQKPTSNLKTIISIPKINNDFKTFYNNQMYMSRKVLGAQKSVNMIVYL